jgi:hypothetical protein
MKKTLLAFVLLLLVSCSNDETQPQQLQACGEPTNVQIQNIGLTSVTIIWNEADNTEWKIEFGETGFIQGNGTIIDITSNFITIENLQQNTTYDAYIKSFCANGVESDWISINSFSTTLDCQIPTNIEITDIQRTEVNITFDSANFSAETELEYGPTGFTTGNGITIIETTDSITLDNLIENTTYDFYIRTKCIDDSFSEWSGINTFTTTACDATFEGDVELNSQQEVNDFVANCYGSINGNLNIRDSFPIGDINDISGLASLTSVTGNINIRFTQLVTLEGLENITSVETISVWDNDLLVSLDAFENVTALESLFLDENPNLTSINSLQNLISINGINIQYCYSLEDISVFSNISSVNYISIEYTAITDLNALSNLSSVTGNFTLDSNQNLTSITGLQNLTSVTGRLIISANNSLPSFDGFQSLQTTGSLEIIGNDAIQNLSGFESLTTITNYSGGTIKGLSISFNDNLMNINALSNLTSVGDISIFLNDRLTTLNGLEGITTINVGDVYIAANPQLNSINGLSNLTSIIDNLTIQDCDSLTSINSLSNLNSIGGDLTIRGNTNLNTLVGLEGITSINTSLDIFDNENLTSLLGLNNLTSVGDEILMSGNNSLITLMGLESLNTVNDKIYIFDNENLESLNGLGNLLTAPNIKIGVNGNGQQRGNPNLSDFCALQNLFINGTTNYGFTNSNNLYNPTKEDIIDGNCQL